MVIRHFFILALLCLSAAFPAFAVTSVTATVDRNPVVMGDVFVLNVSADDNIESHALDTTPLKKDFVVGRVSISRSKQIINFDTSNETRWQIILSPKRLGKLTIPALTVKGVQSQKIALSVLDSHSQAPQTKNLFIKTSLSSKEAYVGQMLTYKVKLYLALDLQRGVLTAPELEGAQIKQLGEDKDSSEIINGKRYRVIERTYAIIADQIGELTIKGATFSGDVLLNNQRSSFMSSFSESRPVQAKSDKSVVLINPEPTEYHGDWLVSDLVLLKEDWPSTQPNYKVGDPITRTIKLLASNTDETSLPNIALNTPATLKIYPEKPQRSTFVREKQMVSQLVQTTAIVPTKAGTYTLPEIKVPWWNPHLKKQEFATLPARVITVVNGENNPEVLAADTPASLTHLGHVQTHSIWPWLTCIFALLWLVTLLMWYKAKTVTASMSTSFDAAKRKQAQTPVKALEAACKAQDPVKVLNALQAYISLQNKRPMTLNMISQQYSELSKVIMQLQQAAYSPNAQQPNYQEIKQQINTLPKQAQNTATPILADLNP